MSNNSALIESVAKVIYEQWKNEKGYVPWVERGNSHRQDAARTLARQALGDMQHDDALFEEIYQAAFDPYAPINGRNAWFKLRDKLKTRIGKDIKETTA